MVQLKSQPKYCEMTPKRYLRIISTGKTYRQLVWQFVVVEWLLLCPDLNYWFSFCLCFYIGFNIMNEVIFIWIKEFIMRYNPQNLLNNIIWIICTYYFCFHWCVLFCFGFYILHVLKSIFCLTIHFPVITLIRAI